MTTADPCSSSEQDTGLRIVATDNLGYIKVLECKSLQKIADTQVVARWGDASKARGISRLSLYDPAWQWSTGQATGTSQLAVGRKDGSVDLCRQDGTGVATLASLPAKSNGAGEVVGVHWMKREAPEGSGWPALVACQAAGIARVITIHQEEGDATPQLSQEATWQVPQNVCCTAFQSDARQLLVGCQGTELTAWDVTTQQKTFTVKGSKPNHLRLMDKPWVTAVDHLGAVEYSKCVVGTGEGKVKVYDIRAKKRPVQQLDFGGGKITCVTSEHDGLRCWVGSGSGECGVFDVRANKVAAKIKGPAGAISCMVLHGSPPLVAVAGLDRFVRLYCSKTRRQLAKVYLKQQLTGVAFLPSPAPPVPSPETPVPTIANGENATDQLRGGGATASTVPSAAVAVGSDVEEEEEEEDAGMAGVPQEGGARRRKAGSHSNARSRKQQKKRKTRA